MRFVYEGNKKAREILTEVLSDSDWEWFVGKKIFKRDDTLTKAAKEQFRKIVAKYPDVHRIELRCGYSGGVSVEVTVTVSDGEYSVAYFSDGAILGRLDDAKFIYDPVTPPLWKDWDHYESELKKCKALREQLDALDIPYFLKDGRCV